MKKLNEHADGAIETKPRPAPEPIFLVRVYGRMTAVPGRDRVSFVPDRYAPESIVGFERVEGAPEEAFVARLIRECGGTRATVTPD